MSNPATAAPEGNVFARILRGELPSHEVYNDARVFAFLDILPMAPGHVIVIPRSYAPTLADAQPEDLAAIMAAVHKLAPAVQAATGAEGCNILSNNGRSAGQTIEYLHFHIIPRHDGDGLSLKGAGPEAGQAELEAMAAKIRAQLAERE